MLAKKDDMLLELKKILATKNAEHALAVKNVELAARRCNNLQSEPKAKRNAMQCTAIATAIRRREHTCIT